MTSRYMKRAASELADNPPTLRGYDKSNWARGSVDGDIDGSANQLHSGGGCGFNRQRGRTRSGSSGAMRPGQAGGIIPVTAEQTRPSLPTWVCPLSTYTSLKEMLTVAADAEGEGSPERQRDTGSPSPEIRKLPL